MEDVKQTIDYLVENGFKEQGDKGKGRVFVLEDSDRMAYIGKRYVFEFGSGVDDYKLTRHTGEVLEYYGSDALSKLKICMKIRNAIAEAEELGLYEIAEHAMCNLDLWE